MSACRAVLETCELLEAVLLELSPWQLGTAILVSKTWRTVLLDSSRSPEVTVIEQYESTQHTDIAEGTVVHPLATNFRLNYALPHIREYDYTIGQKSREDILMFREKHSFEFCSAHEFALFNQANPHEFASSPPVRSMFIRRCAPPAKSAFIRRFDLREKQGVLRVESGIRMRDLEATMRKGMDGGTYAIQGEFFVLVTGS